jgi:hypothetical protein
MKETLDLVKLAGDFLTALPAASAMRVPDENTE